MTTKSGLGRVALIAAAFTLTACDVPTRPVGVADVGGSVANAAGGGTTLFFNGINANASTPLGTVLTTQIDDIEVDAMVRYDGVNAAATHQMIYINGHGGVSGWGIIVLGEPHGLPDGSVGILQSGIDVPMTGLVLTKGVWHHVTARRQASVITVTVDDQTVDLGPRGVNPVGGVFAAIERTTVGGDGTFSAPTGDFNGAIDKVRVRNLTNDTWIERWNFNGGQGTTATGVNGTVLGIGNASWARRGNP